MTALPGLPFAIYLYGPQAGPLACRFEDAAERLEQLERVHFEWDGSFVWRNAVGEEPWQIDGMLYDLGDRIQYVDLKGRCPLAAWRDLLEILTPRGAELTVLRLPQRVAMDRLRFEEEIWGKASPPDQLA